MSWPARLLLVSDPFRMLRRVPFHSSLGGRSWLGSKQKISKHRPSPARRAPRYRLRPHDHLGQRDFHLPFITISFLFVTVRGSVDAPLSALCQLNVPDMLFYRTDSDVPRPREKWILGSRFDEIRSKVRTVPGSCAHVQKYIRRPWQFQIPLLHHFLDLRLDV